MPNTGPVGLGGPQHAGGKWVMEFVPIAEHRPSAGGGLAAGCSSIADRGVVGSLSHRCRRTRLLSWPEAQAIAAMRGGRAVAMSSVCWGFLLHEQEAARLDPHFRRGQTRHSPAHIYFAGLPVWRQRCGKWHAFCHIHIKAPTREDCEAAFTEMIDGLLIQEDLAFEHVPQPVECELEPDPVEVRPDVLAEFDFNPKTARGSPGDDCGEV